MDASNVVGRSDELDRIRELLFASGTLPATCLLLGDAGMGKTTVWRAVTGEARERGFRILTTSGAEVEVQLALSGVRDLVASGLDDVALELAPPQRRLLEVLLLREDPGPAPLDQGAISAAFLAFVRALAARSPVLIAIDDVHWLDAASWVAVAYALRRIRTEPVAALLAGRDEGIWARGPAVDGERQATVRLGPLSIGAIGAVLRERLPGQVSRPVLVAVHEQAAGNPLFAVELVRALAEAGQGHTPGAPLPVATSLRELLRARLGGLGPGPLEVLGVAAAMARPGIGVLTETLGRDPWPDLDPSVDAAIVEVEGDRLRFAHPLLASVAYELAVPRRRRDMHRRLAAVVQDPEERARHLALATVEPDPDVASTVEDGARLSFARGSPAAAADLAHHARRLTPASDGPARRRRTLAEADYQFAAGNTSVASARLDDLLRETSPGPEHAALLGRRARLHHFGDDIGTSVGILQEALAETGEDAALRAGIEEGLAWGLMMIRRDLPAAADHARSAAELAGGAGDVVTRAEGLAAQALAECLLGRPWTATMDAALELEPAMLELRVLRQPSFAHAYCLASTGELDRAQAAFEELERRAARQGDESSMPSILNHLAFAQLLAGRWADAERRLDEGDDRALETGQAPSRAAILGKQALLAAWRGDVERARGKAAAALAVAAGPAFDPAAPERAIARGGESAIWALAHLSLTAGEPAEACGLFAPMTRALAGAGVAEPGEMPWLADEIEALIAADRRPEAVEALDRLEAWSRGLRRPASLAAAARSRGLLCAARGELDAARVSLEAAADGFDALHLPFGRARALLALGGVQRRGREHRLARETLQGALATFEEVGASAWAARTRTELERVGGRRPAAPGLSPTERQVAALAGAGKTNREVAAELFLSVHTVEAALTSVYGKLGIRSRTELARQHRDSD